MPVLLFDNCCFCIDLRAGSLLIGYLELIYNTIVATTSTTLWICETSSSQHESSLAIAASILYLLVVYVGVVMAVVLLIGIFKNKRVLVLAYLNVTATFLIIGIIGLVLTIIEGPEVYSTTNDLVSIVINIYCWLVIRSYYYKMDAYVTLISSA